MDRAEAVRIWESYLDTKQVLSLKDAELEAAFGVNPRRALAYDRQFWSDTYTPEFERILEGR